MLTIPGTGEVPAVYTAHHASHNYGEFESRVALTPEQRIRFSDYGTDKTVALNGLGVIIAQRSRALGDLNRDPNDPGRFAMQDYSKPERQPIWLPGQALTDPEKAACQSLYYEPFHEKIIELLAGSEQLRFVVAWDNTAHYQIGKNDAGEPVIMKPVILSNRGREDSAHATETEPTSCDPVFLEMLAQNLRNQLAAHGLPNEVRLNLVYKGGYICRRYSTLRNQESLAIHGIRGEVQSLQVEYDTIITHNQETLQENPNSMQLLQQAFSTAMQQAYNDYTKNRARSA